MSHNHVLCDNLLISSKDTSDWWATVKYNKIYSMDPDRFQKPEPSLLEIYVKALFFMSTEVQVLTPIGTRTEVGQIYLNGFDSMVAASAVTMKEINSVENYDLVKQETELKKNVVVKSKIVDNGPAIQCRDYFFAKPVDLDELESPNSDVVPDRLEWKDFCYDPIKKFVEANPDPIVYTKKGYVPFAEFT